MSRLLFLGFPAFCLLALACDRDSTPAQSPKPPSPASAMQQVPVSDQVEIEGLQSKARASGVPYMVAFGDIPLFRASPTARRFFVGNSAADQVIGHGPGGLPEGYLRWDLGVAALQTLDKKAKDAGFDAGYRDDVLYIFFKGWQRPAVFQLCPAGTTLPPRTLADEERVINEKADRLKDQIIQQQQRLRDAERHR